MAGQSKSRGYSNSRNRRSYSRPMVGTRNIEYYARKEREEAEAEAQQAAAKTQDQTEANGDKKNG